MNIAVLTVSGSYYFRPDTTLNREAEEYYVPDGVESLNLVPCIFSRIGKAGKCISSRFARRYINNFCFGVLLDAPELCAGEATCMDATTCLSAAMPLEELGNAVFEVNLNGRPCFRYDDFNFGMLSDALVKITRRSSVRASDMIAVCLSDGIRLEKGDSCTFARRSLSIL